MKDLLPFGNSPVISIGPFISETDGKTILDSLTILPAHIKISKNYGALVAKEPEPIEAPPMVVYDAFGMYRLQIYVADVDTLGRFELIIQTPGALPVRHVYEVRNLYFVRIDHQGNGVMTPADGDVYVYEGENLNVLGTPAGMDAVSSVTVDDNPVGSEYYNNVDGLAPKYYAFQNIAKSHTIRFVFSAPA